MDTRHEARLGSDKSLKLFFELDSDETFDSFNLDFFNYVCMYVCGTIPFHGTHM